MTSLWVRDVKVIFLFFYDRWCKSKKVIIQLYIDSGACDFGISEMWIMLWSSELD